MNAPHDVVVLFDVDNTLLDNDRVLADLREHMAREFGEQNSRDYWQTFEQLRSEMGYADYLGALQRYRQTHQNDSHLLLMSSFLIDYPFPDRLFPGALDAVRHAASFGAPAILSDGDVVFQPRKISRSGLWDAMEGRVMIYVHKEVMLDEVAARYPARHYVMVDDKVRLLAAMKKIWGERLTTVFPRQGHYAHDAAEVAKYPAADITIEHIAEFAQIDPQRLGANP